MTLVEVSDEPFICPECDKEFDSKRSLDGHRVHHRQSKVPCPDCGQEYFSGPGLGVHRAAAHGLPRRGRPPGAKNKEPRQPKAPDLTVDEIFNSVVGILWPKGNVPATVIVPLVRWRDATQKMLDEIKS